MASTALPVKVISGLNRPHIRTSLCPLVRLFTTAHSILAGRLAVFGIPMPIHIGPISINLRSITKVEYVGFSGPLFSITAQGEDLQFEARSQGQRNLWVSSIQQWMQYPTGKVLHKPPPPPPRPAAAVFPLVDPLKRPDEEPLEESDACASGEFDDWESVEMTSTEPSNAEQYVELDFDTYGFKIEPQVVQCS